MQHPHSTSSAAYPQVHEVQNVLKRMGRAANVLTIHLQALSFFFFFLFTKQPKHTAKEQLQRSCGKLSPSSNNFLCAEEERIGAGRGCDVSLQCQPERQETFLGTLMLPPGWSFFLSPPPCSHCSLNSGVSYYLGQKSIIDSLAIIDTSATRWTLLLRKNKQETGLLLDNSKFY